MIALLYCRYINEIVATRQLPPSAKTTTPRVIMKMDIEVVQGCGSGVYIIFWDPNS